jgi:integrase
MSPKARNYGNLHKLDWTPNWVFRKYSSQKRKEFVASTGFPAEEKYAPQAYKKGIELFNEWLGQYVESGRQLLIKDLARAVLASKESKKGGKHGATYRSAHNQITNHIIPAFGHFRPDQLTSLKWEQYDTEERRNGKRTALANTRKFVVEIMNRALDEGLVRRIPDFKNNDPESAPPRYLYRAEIRRFMRGAAPTTKLLAFIMWKQGPRPSEVLQYRFSMIRFEDGPHGTIEIPGKITKNGKTRIIPLNSRVSRVLRYLKARSNSDCLFPSPKNPNEPMQEYKTGFETAFRRAELDAIPYNFRDTAITDMLRRGLSSIFIAKYVQNSALIIEKRYAVALTDSLRKVAG